MDVDPTVEQAPEQALRRRGPGRPPGSGGGETRQLIVQAATRQFGRNGYDGASLSAIADEAGLTRTAVYNYFDSKAALARAVLFEPDGEALDRLWWRVSMVEGSTAREQLRSLLQASVDGALEGLMISDFYLGIVRESADDPELRQVLGDWIARLRASVLDIVESAVESGELPRDLDVEHIVDAMLGLTWALSSGITTAPSERVRRQVAASLDLVLQLAPWHETQRGT